MSRRLMDISVTGYLLGDGQNWLNEQIDHHRTDLLCETNDMEEYIS